MLEDLSKERVRTLNHPSNLFEKHCNIETLEVSEGQATFVLEIAHLVLFNPLNL